MAAAKEQQFLTELRKSALLVDPQSQWYKIADSPGTRDGFHSISEKPFDAFWMTQGQLYCFEAKYHASTQAFPLSKIRWGSDTRDGQVDNLKKWARAGARAFFIVKVQNSTDKFVAVLAPEAVAGWLGMNRKSVPIDQLKADAMFVMQRVKHIREGMYWPLDRLMHWINKDCHE